MALRTTPTIAICLTAGIAAGIALARPGDSSTAADPRYESSGAAEVAEAADTAGADEAPTDPYGAPPPAEDGGGTAGESEPAADAASEPVEVASITIEGFAFSGATAVAPGQSIEVTNLDGADHTLTADDRSFDTGRLGQNGAATLVAPAEPGTYTYFCIIHPSMTGSIDVG